MHGDVRGAGEQSAFRIKQGAGEVESLADVRGDGGATKQGSHVANDAVEAMAEEIAFDHRRCGCFAIEAKDVTEASRTVHAPTR